jgi:zinc transporter ZupT
METAATEKKRMPEVLTTEEATASRLKKPSLQLVLLSALVPLVLLGALIYLFVARGTGLTPRAPAPLERLDIERLVFSPSEILAHVVNSGPEPVTISHVQVDWFNRASWEFEVTPDPTVAPRKKAVVRIPYPWVEGEPYEIFLISSNGLLFSRGVEMATETPEPTLEMVGRFSLLGVYVGVIPVYLGILWLPFLRRLASRWYGFMLSLTVGLLVFIGIDALSEALEVSARLPAIYNGLGIIILAFLGSLLLLFGFSRGVERRARSRAGSDAAMSPLVLSYLVAFGIGIHNLGEGLAIGGAYALGEVAVGSLLVLGFTIHNLTEGVAVVAPVVQTRFRWSHLVWLGLVAGAPTIVGACMGAFTYSDVWAVAFLAVGAGAVFQVVVEIASRMAGTSLANLATGHNVAGFILGLAVMYVTGLFVVA